jgi:hypothetical protein
LVQRLNASTEAKIERKDTMLVDASDLATLGVGDGPDGGASGGVEGDKGLRKISSMGICMAN